jgi:hypothetical protein
MPFLNIYDVPVALAGAMKSPAESALTVVAAARTKPLILGAERMGSTDLSTLGLTQPVRNGGV